MPEIALAKVAALLRLKTSAALFVMAEVPKVPVVEPAPTWTVPEAMVKVPEKEFVPSMISVFEPEPSDLLKAAPLLICRTFLSVPDCRFRAPVPEPTDSVEVPMAKPPMSSVPPFRVIVLFTTPSVLVYARSAPKVSVPPVTESVDVAVAAATEVLARLSVVTLRVPPETFRLATEALPVPVFAELFRFMFSVVIVVAPPLTFIVALTGPPVWAVAPPPMELLPRVKVVMPTVPPPMLSVPAAWPLVVAVVAEFEAMTAVPKVTTPVPPPTFRFTVPVTVPEVAVVPDRLAIFRVVASRVPVSKLKVPERGAAVNPEAPATPKLLRSKSAECPVSVTLPSMVKPVPALPYER